MNKKIIIAIDGHSSTGKSTLAKELAKELKYLYLDTGAMYRMVTLFTMQNDIIDKNNFDKKLLVDNLKNIKIDFVYNEKLGFSEAYLNNENVEKQIRTIEVSNFVSEISKVLEVRELLVSQQRKIGKSKAIVMDGRDIGTVVFPNAELKIFMTASPEIRAKRRFEELKNKDEKVSYNEVLENVTTRDREDSNRENSPLVKAHDAITIDNSDIGKKEQFEIVLALAKKKINN